ncbi:MAG: hypothetical protein ACREEQ_06795, partial [Caulobacteraceae bacterium]
LWVGLLALVCLVAGAAGWRVVFQGYAFSLDEFLANFDARIFASGHIAAPIPPPWRPYAEAMQPMYMLPLPDSFWASSYLPVNAALRALGRLAHAESLVNPLLSAFAVVAVYAVARRLWPQRRDLALVAAGLLGTSAQLIVMSMTAYAMPAHLAFDLAWLWLFLRGGKAGHAGAIAVGFFATGIHQLLFHPLFVAPFVLQLWLSRRWRLAGLYTLAYAFICLFWVEYWPMEMRLLGVVAASDDGAGMTNFAGRAMDALARIRVDNVGLMAESLMRFVTWQNPLAAPLAVAGALAAERAKGHLRSLVFGIVLTLLAMLFIVPTQTHGWGYRYMHGLLGSFCLIAAWSWGRLTDGLPPARAKAAAGSLALACAISLLVFVPLRAWQAWSYVRPYAAANAAIQASPAKVVLIDHDGALLFDMGTVTRNDPFLIKGPKVMALAAMDAPMVRRLCASGQSIAVFNGRDAQAFGIDVIRQPPDPYAARLRALLASLKCGQPMPAP